VCVSLYEKYLSLFIWDIQGNKTKYIDLEPPSHEVFNFLFLEYLLILLYLPHIELNMSLNSWYKMTNFLHTITGEH